MIFQIVHAMCWGASFAFFLLCDSFVMMATGKGVKCHFLNSRTRWCFTDLQTTSSSGATASGQTASPHNKHTPPLLPCVIPSLLSPQSSLSSSHFLFPPPLLCPGRQPSSVCAHMLHLQHAILHAERQRTDPRSFSHSHYLHKQSPAPFLWQKPTKSLRPFHVLSARRSPLSPTVVGLGRAHNEPGRMEADWRNAPQ